MSGLRRRVAPEEALDALEGRECLPEQVQGAQSASPSLRGLSAGQLLTAAQLAARWQVPKAHVYRLSRSGQIPLVKLGRYFRYRLDAIEAWEEGRPHA